MDLESIIVKALSTNPEFLRQVAPFLNRNYFTSKSNQILYLIADKYFKKYNACPTPEVFSVEVDKLQNINEATYHETIQALDQINNLEINSDTKWLLDSTEEYIKDRALHIAFTKALEIYKGGDDKQKLSTTSIPTIMAEALSVGLSSKLGHDFVEDTEHQLDFYHDETHRIKLDVDILNDIYNGGIPRKTLTTLIAGCVSPETLVKLRITRANTSYESITTLAISSIKWLLEKGQTVEIDSPDGFVNVSQFVEKGNFRYYRCSNIDSNKVIYVNKDHLFDTINGWQSAKQLAGDIPVLILTDNKIYEEFYIEKTDINSRIVDIQVDHPNHRYYADGISSHNTHVGKSLMMCSLGAGAWMQGSNVLYITLEESEEKIRQRIDANLLNLTMDELIKVDKELYRKRSKQIERRAKGQLKIREYPNRGAGVSTFKQLLTDFKSKGFVPDLICVDYMNITKSDGFNDLSNTNGNLKSISEELRSLGQCTDFHPLGHAIITGAQLNRSASQDSDPDMTGVAEGYASVFSADHVLIITAPDELRARDMLSCVQGKNRAKNMFYKKRFVIGCDPYRMRVYDIEEAHQPPQDIDTPVFDNTRTGEKLHDKHNKFNDLTYDLIDSSTREIIQENVKPT